MAKRNFPFIGLLSWNRKIFAGALTLAFIFQPQGAVVMVM
jgi:hypothetical protein